MSAFIKKLEAGIALSAADKALIQEMLEPAFSVGPNQDLVVAGQRHTRVHVVLDGIACRYKFRQDGSRAIMAYLIPGDCCDLHVALLKEMDHSIATLTQCTVAEISRESVECLLLNRRIACALWRAMLVDEAVLRAWIVNIGRRPADRKLAHLLCELRLRFAAVGMTAGASDFKLPFTLLGLNDALGISSVDVHRTLQKLCERRLISAEGQTMTIQDLRRLAEFAGFEENYLHLRRRPILEEAAVADPAKVYLH